MTKRVVRNKDWMELRLGFAGPSSLRLLLNQLPQVEGSTWEWARDKISLSRIRSNDVAIVLRRTVTDGQGEGVHTIRQWLFKPYQTLGDAWAEITESVTAPGPSPGPSPARELRAHRVNGLNEELVVLCLDDPGAGGACHKYVVLRYSGAPLEQNRSDGDSCTYRFNDDDYVKINKECTEALLCQGSELTPCAVTAIEFQKGPIQDEGVNGISNEALLAILLDRMEGFQSGAYACHDNQVVLDHLQTARLWLHKRTMDRLQRGVEGTNQK